MKAESPVSTGAGPGAAARVRSAVTPTPRSPRELAVATAWFPEEMTLLNDEYEWITIDLE